MPGRTSLAKAILHHNYAHRLAQLHGHENPDEYARQYALRKWAKRKVKKLYKSRSKSRRTKSRSKSRRAKSRSRAHHRSKSAIKLARALAYHRLLRNLNQ